MLKDVRICDEKTLRILTFCVLIEVSLEKELEENKLGRWDILALLDNHTIVNIEMQIRN